MDTAEQTALRAESKKVLNPKWMKEVAATTDSDLRAHRIALTYRRLAEILDTAIHGSPAKDANGERRPVVNANWFHFALWGTLTVSQNIGNDRSPQRLNSGLAAPLRRRLTPSVLRMKASDGQRVGRALAWGQLLIFQQVCGVLDQWLELSQVGTNLVEQSAGGLSSDSTLQFVGSLDKAELNEDRHIKPLLRAFEFYSLASQVGASGLPNAEQARAQLVLGGNVLITAVEQDLVDPALRIVVDLVPQALAGAVSWRLARVAERARGVPPHLSYVMLETKRAVERQVIDTLWSRLMTDQVLVMALPTETLRLGRDIPPRHRDLPFYPTALRHLAARRATTTQASAHAKGSLPEQILTALLEVADQLRSVDRTVQDGRGSAARDWRRWDERMNWATTLIRSRQQDDTLYWLPYSRRDERRIKAGDLPQRAGDPSALEVRAPLDAGIYNKAVPRSARRDW